MKNAATESTKVLAGLESEQTMLQLFRQCTVHKLTHLYAADVASRDGNTNDNVSFPTNWDCWSSAMTVDFTRMVNDFLCALTKQKHMPLSAQLLSTISVNNGGLGISHPRAVAIPNFVLSIRRCLQSAIEGVWVGHTHDNVKLPKTITDLYKGWETSTSKIFRIFNRYRMDIANVCVKLSASREISRWEFFCTACCKTPVANG